VGVKAESEELLLLFWIKLPLDEFVCVLVFIIKLDDEDEALLDVPHVSWLFNDNMPPARKVPALPTALL